MGNMGHEGVREIMEGVAGSMEHERVREIYGQVPITLTTLHPYQSTGFNPTPPDRHNLNLKYYEYSLSKLDKTCPVGSLDS